ncbi:hypothetical protein WAB17_11635 [Parerythrobacter aurantius]|uniref:hypothetical protein n=1 Tax=Parerythrobacter aurantius TaxID=3127706 RepID=UPI003250F8E7
MGSDTAPRTALLALGPATGMCASRRVVAGASAVERQVDAALALGCSRIWLYTAEQDGLALRVQRLAEDGGAQFRLIHRGRQILGSLRQQDELVVFGEGVLPGAGEALEHLRHGPAVLTVQASTGVPAGLERLDREWCWAGASVLPGRVIERLDALDDDIEPVSALLRAARAARVPERALPDEWLANGLWSVDAAHPPASVAGRIPEDATPVERGFVFPVARFMVGRPGLALAALTAGFLALAGGLAALALDRPPVALLLAAAASLMARLWLAADAQSDPRVFSRAPTGLGKTALPLAGDILGGLALVLGLLPQFGWAVTLYVAGMTGATWVLASLGRGPATRFFRDRELLWCATGIAGLAGAWLAGPAVAGGLSLGGILLNMRNRAAITGA